MPELASTRPAGIILSGGPASGVRGRRARGRSAALRPGRPGARDLLRASVDGAGARRRGRRHGTARVRRDDADGRPSRACCSTTCTPTEQVWMSHGDAVVREPEGFRVGAHTDVIPIAAMEDPERGLYAVQFHPEVAHTLGGINVMKRFLYDACGLLPDWTPVNVIERAVDRDPRAGGRRPVLCALSGGVDSRGRRAPRASRRGGSADVRLRGSRPEPRGRARAGRGDVRPALPDPVGAREGGGPVPRQAGGRHRPRGEAQGDRRGVHPCLRGGRPRSRRRAGSWCRAPCIRT